MNETNIKGVNALSYLSVIIAPVIIPLIVWIVAKEADVISNAKKALLIQIIPFLFVVLSFITIGVIGLSTNSGPITGFTTIILFAIAGLVSFVLYIYSIVLGIKQLLAS